MRETFQAPPTKTTLIKGNIVAVSFRMNDKPVSQLYDFGYYTTYGCVVYIHGEEFHVQNSYAFDMDQIRPATEEDLKNLLFGL